MTEYTPGQVSLRIKLIGLGLCLFLGVLLTEGAVRIYLSYMNLNPVVPKSVGRFDPHLGWSPEPLSQGYSSRTGYPIEYRINSKGLRDTETDYQKPDSLFRIVVLGDSRAFGFGVPIEKHFTALLEGYFRQVEVINMGVAGFGVDQQLLFLKSEGFRYEPNLILAYVAHYGGHRHMHAERWGKQKPYFLPKNGKLVLKNSPIPDPGTAFFGWLHTRIVTYSRVYEIINNRLMQPRALAQKNQIQRRENTANMQDPEFSRMLYNTGDRIIYAMHEESARRGAAFVLVTQMSRLYKAAADRDIPVLNVDGALSNERYTLPDGLQHINEPGNGVLAWEITRFLKEGGLIPDRHLIPDRGN